MKKTSLILLLFLATFSAKGATFGERAGPDGLPYSYGVFGGATPLSDGGLVLGAGFPQLPEGCLETTQDKPRDPLQALRFQPDPSKFQFGVQLKIALGGGASPKLRIILPKGFFKALERKTSAQQAAAELTLVEKDKTLERCVMIGTGVVFVAVGVLLGH